MDRHAHISPHFTWGEVSTTQHRDPVILAAQDALPADVEENARSRTAPLMEQIRARVAGPILVSSWYRCPLLNASIGGAKHSQHMEGLAVDFTVPGLSVRGLYELIRALDPSTLDQAIYEFSRWVHVSAAPATRPARRQYLMIFDPGRYLPWNPNDPRLA